ncbi:MAG: type II toxin-antitoxin system RelE/ParE family toxin [Methylococcales bacterium]|nr:type II toxin-antitoxin system RelE/ParE family toxin [Methylococcales bacterium]
MRTVIETPTFQKQVAKIWTDDERLAFIDWIAVNPLAGDVIPNADGARKVRWSITGNGKRGGVRVIYFNITEQGTIVLITLYQKSEQTNITKKEIKKAI